MAAIEVAYVEKPRGYTVNGKKAPSVTTIIGQTTDKGALPHAAAKVTVQGICKLHRKFKGNLPFDDADALYAELKANGLAHYQVWKQAADRGTLVHDAAEAWQERGEIPVAGDYPRHVQGYIRAYAAWLIAHRPEYVASEVLLGSATHLFAGRMDMELRITRRCDVKGCACQRIELGSFGRGDYKTSGRVYAVTHFAQLDGYEIAAREMGRERAQWAVVVRLGEDGRYEMVRSTAAHGCFLPFLDAYNSQRRIESSAKATK